MEDKILDAIEQLRNEIRSLKSVNHTGRSEQVNELYTALAKAQGEMRMAHTNSKNPYFKSRYADLSEVVQAARPVLAKYGLCVMQPVYPTSDGQNIMHTILGHSSGQWIETRMRVLPAKNDVQTMGSYMTYLRRYCFASLVGVVASDEDDDGEKAMAESREVFAKGVALNNKYNPREESPDVISKEQMDEFEYELAQYPDIAEQILDGFKIQSIADIPKSKYRAALQRVREIKNLRNGVI